MSSPAARYQFRTGVLTVTTPGEEVLMDYTSGKYFGLRGPVVHLVGLLQDGTEFAEMASVLQTVYEIDSLTAESDLTAILGKLVDAGLVQAE